MRRAGWLLLAFPLLLAGQGDAARKTAPVAAPVAAAAAPAPAQPGVVARAQARRDADKYDETFRRYSKRYFGVAFDWRWFKAQGMAESNLDSAATSFVGARGVMQLMPATYRMIQSKRPEFGPIDDPEWNIEIGRAHV